MRIMMDDDQIHPDVIAKLWGVYSESIGSWKFNEY
jgi:hypothetical protein